MGDVQHLVQDEELFQHLFHRQRRVGEDQFPWLLVPLAWTPGRGRSWVRWGEKREKTWSPRGDPRSFCVPSRLLQLEDLLQGEAVEKGTDFDQLPEVYIIFITEHDVMGKGRPLYQVERCILETGERFSAGTA